MDYIKKGRGTLTIAKGVYIKIFDDNLTIFKSENVSNKNKEHSFSVPIADLLTHPQDKFIISVVDFENFRKGHDLRNFSKKILDYDLIPKGSVFRSRDSGDVVSLPFRNVKKTIKKFFNEEKVPTDKRYSLALIANKNNVFWIEDIGTVSDCFVDESVTKKILYIERRN